MKTVHLIRHAKAAAPLGNNVESDKARRLHPDAHGQAEDLASYVFRGSAFFPEVLYYSTATRCVETVQLMADFGLCQDMELVGDAGLYDTNANELLEFIQEQDDDHAGIAIVGHMPYLQQLALALINDGNTDNIMRLSHGIPTMGMVEICFDANNWHDVALSSGTLEQFICPQISKTSFQAPLFGIQSGPLMRSVGMSSANMRSMAHTA